MPREKFNLMAEEYHLTRQELRDFLLDFMDWTDDPLPNGWTIEGALDLFIDSKLTSIKKSI
ncbi:hypothetical protein [Lactococcus lactis]|uniref:Uncharacterized protein n=1 Tax=Lactococcus lactis TaxID=1358 RepID=A0AAW5TN94_9LACT|nr:hypothetical protein [Lactococcus lactis]MCW2281466.1 hypothetical protein [Lactococcus lactis]